MPLTINWPEPGQTLQKQFGLKGRIPLSIDETVVAVSVLEDVRAPWSSRRSVARHRSQAAVPLENSGIMATPGAGVVLAIDHVFIDNAQANAIRVDLRVLSAAAVAGVVPIATSNFNDMQNPIQTDGSIARTGSVLTSLTRVGATGNVLARLNIAANESDDFELTTPFYFDGDAPGGVGGLVAWNLVVNEPFAASFHGFEYVNRS